MRSSFASVLRVLSPNFSPDHIKIDQEQAHASLKQTLQLINDSYLEKGPFLMGVAEISIADLSAVQEIVQLDGIDYDYRTEYPNIKAWIERVHGRTEKNWDISNSFLNHVVEQRKKMAAAVASSGPCTSNIVIPSQLNVSSVSSMPISPLPAPVKPSPTDLSALSITLFPELRPLLRVDPAKPLTTTHIYTAASVYLYDSFHCRSIQHSTNLDALLTYKFIHVSKWKSFVRWVSWIHLLLGFIEPPSSILINSTRYGPSHAVCGALELICLAIYTFHAVKQYKAYGRGAKGYFRSPWRTAKIPILIICFVDILISMGRNVDTPGVHLSQILRVFFVLEQSGRMRQLCSCIFKSLPTIISIMFLCFVHVFVFGVIGYLFISPVEERSEINPDDPLFFSSLTRSFLSLFILLTSANFPAVMLPSYRQHWFVCIFFVLFLIIGLYGLLQLTIAVVFHSFQLHTKDKLQKALYYRERALQAAFTLLSEYTHGSGTIQMETWTQLIQQVRPDWTELQAQILFHSATNSANADESPMDHSPIPNPVRASLATLHEGDESHEASTNTVRSSSISSSSISPSSSSSRMNYEQFEQIVRFTQKSFPFVTSSNEMELHTSDQGTTHGGGIGGVTTSSSTSVRSPSSDNHSIAMMTLSSNVPLSDASISLQPEQSSMHHYQYGTWFWNALIQYYTYRIRLPKLILRLIGRSEEYIRERENDGSIDADGLNLDTVADQTPIHPILGIRTLLTSFNLSDFISDFLVVLHGIFLVSSLYLRTRTDSDQHSNEIDGLTGMVIVLEVQFLLELLTKLAVCRSRFFISRLQILDLVTITIVWIGQILVWSRPTIVMDAISYIRLSRGFRLYHRLSSFTLLLQVLSQVGPPLAALLGVLFILLYTYSQIGMMFFCNELLPGNLISDLDYDVDDFYALNFNDLAHSLVALFHQLVVNDWYKLMEAVVFRVGVTARIYFISFYCISVLIVASVCTAFVVEAYMGMHETKMAASQKGKSSTPKSPIESVPMPQPVSVAPGLAKEANEGGGLEGSRLRKASRDLTRDAKKDEDEFASFNSTVSNGNESGLRRRTTTTAPPTFHQIQLQLLNQGAGTLSSVRANLPDSTTVSSSSTNSTNFIIPNFAMAPRISVADSSPSMNESHPLTTEAAILSRIRTRAISVGLSVKLKPTGGMVNTLKNIFGSDLSQKTGVGGAHENMTIEETDETEDT